MARGDPLGGVGPVGPYRKTFNDTLPDATQVADPFHVCKLANSRHDECRRRVQNETLGHRGRKDDPLYRLFGVQRGVTVSSRSQLGLPA